jgi:mannosyltransferase
MMTVKRFLKAAEKYWWAWPLLAAVATYLLVMSLSNGQSVWFDEGYSIILAQRPVPELWALTSVDAHPPLYYLLLKAWAGVFGWGEFALRSLSAILLSFAVGGMFLLVKKLFTARVALVVLPFLVLAPFALRYGYEIRMYALVLLIGVLATLVMVYASAQKKSKLWILYAVLVALGMLTLYMSAVIWLAHAVWLFMNWKKKSWKTLFKQPWVIAFLGAVVLFAFYIPTLVYQLTHSALPGVGKQLTLTELANIAGVVTVFTPEYKLTGLLSLGIIGIIGLAIYLLGNAYRKIPKAQKPSLWLVISMVVVPFLFFALVSALAPIFITRYIAHVSIYMYALVGVAVALGWRYGKRRVAVGLAVLSIALSIFGVFQLQAAGNFIFERSQYPETHQIRSDITCDADTVVVADDPYTYIDTRYYFNDCRQFYFFSKNDVAKQGGYAPLSGSEARLSSSESLTSQRLVQLRWEGEPNFVPDSRYELVLSKQYGKQLVDIYQLQQ